eukprot:CAMPEP_0181035726 /NCGR_PEP_ID=MMETSP1070-20121207/8474_1 /TAXON_ID=265543 /ORGANISM="Minutocellus polymorphus, Strain NH13" /LENGTH=489 /DNA_ID=CAMNT_0023113299 /DNA_START=61 /DNA_END=1530 /DNA_ORIENTATION=-
MRIARLTASAGLLAIALMITIASDAPHHCVSAASSPPPTSSLPRFPKSSPEAPSKKVRLVSVQVVHRHGDRTPITPMKNETYWGSILPPSHVLEGIAKGTKLVHDENSLAGANHAAGGRGVFGQLSQLGLLQMVDLGNRLREELHLDDEANDNGDDIHHEDEHGNKYIYGGKLFHGKAPLHPQRIKVTSTNFPRTLQSVQGLLVGLFPDGTDDHHVDIDVTKTNEMIPDPQPRRTQEQADLERELAARPHLAEKEKEMRGLAVRATDAIRHTLGDDYEKFIFGVGEENGDSTSGDNSHQTKPLSWSQLAEITTCLKSRDMLPKQITDADQEAISSHAAWRWFQNLRHPRLARLAMYEMVQDIVDGLHRSKNCPRSGTDDDEPLLHVFSAHDSTLMGLICAFHLQQPSQWPHYASYIKVELIEVEDMHPSEASRSQKEYFVRFSLNGEVLRSTWSKDEESGELRDLISVDKLTEMVNKEHHDDEVAMMEG